MDGDQLQFKVIFTARYRLHQVRSLSNFDKIEPVTDLSFGAGSLKKSLAHFAPGSVFFFSTQVPHHLLC